MSEMKKILLSAFATSALLLAGCSDSGDEVASTEAGRIRELDLYEEMKNEPLQSGMTVGETVLQRMLLQDVFEHLYGDQVTDETVDAEFEESAEQFGTVEEYESLLEMQGIDIDFVKGNGEWKDIKEHIKVEEQKWIRKSRKALLYEDEQLYRIK